MPAKVSQEELLKEVELMNEDPDVDGLLVQLPLPGHMDERAVCNAVDPRKDVDGFNIVNIGSYCASEKSFVPSVSAAVMEIIKRSGDWIDYVIIIMIDCLLHTCFCGYVFSF